jgi:predicted esterase
MSVHTGEPLVTAGADPRAARGVVIAVHGRGAGPENILDLAPRLGRMDLAWVAPTAQGRTWYPFSFMADIATNEPWLSSALAVLARVVDDVVGGGVPRERIALLGFSQGACLAAEFAARHAGRYGGLVLFSGGLIGPPGTPRDYPGSFAGTPVFLGSSDPDSHVPPARVDETADVYTRLGALVIKRIYPNMGHTISDDELSEARRILGGL